MEKSKNKCWVCGSYDLVKIKDSNVTEELVSDNYAITNSDYGKTGELSKCLNCHFIQCTKENDVIHFYENLVDTEYETTRAQRKIQEQRILKLIHKFKPKGNLLDIGSGSGILVEAALEMGYDAEGIEPSVWLHKKAKERGLPVHNGTFPMKNIDDEYDIIVLVDVIEHVNNPKQLISEIRKKLKTEGIFVMITPDVSSFFARILKFRWWHYRIAHIGYFNKKNLKLLTNSSGYKQILFKRPSWYFKIDYLVKRLYKFLPSFLHIPIPQFIRQIVIPLNLGDSMLVIYKKNDD
jgi:2-polyprenyl-3-methyl-5-hydroxy-6-metoxy-1,4-benzoquinol methylase